MKIFNDQAKSLLQGQCVNSLMVYKEFFPDSRLKEKIECYWKFVVPPKPDNSNDPIAHVFPPEGSCSLIFIKLLNLNQQVIAFVGPSTVVPQVNVFPNSVIFGIRLHPGFSALLFKGSPSTIVNTSRVFQPNEIEDWQRNFLETLSPTSTDCSPLGEILLNVFNRNVQLPDQRIINAIQFIISRKGDVTLSEAAEVAALSERQLQRLFLITTGITVKQFCQIRRLRNAIIELYLQKKDALTVSDYGFSDLSHFYKSFRNIGKYSHQKFLKHIQNIEHHVI